MIKEEMHEVVVSVLEIVPSHRDSPKSAEEIANFVTNDKGANADVIYGMTTATIAFLDILGVLEWTGQSCRLSHQIPDYFRHSLHWYFNNNQQVLSNWTREGVARELGINNLLDTASYFVKLMEIKRLEICQKKKIGSGVSRIQSVSVILVKGVEKNKSYFLHQWDDRSEQFQLIGGRQRGEELPIDTAKRELHEEISRHNLVYGKNYELEQLTSTPIKFEDVSRTYGAITAYEFSIFGVKLNLEKLCLSPIDRWIPLEEMKNGVTSTGKNIRDPHIYRLFDANILNGFEGVPQSINIRQTVNYSDFIEIKPSVGWLGSIDLKGIFLHWCKGKKDKP